MIKLETDNGLVLLILEPGNFRRLKQGDPIVLDPEHTGLNKPIALCWTPDIEWLAEKLNHEVPESTREMATLLVDGLSRKEVDRGARAN